MQFIIENNRHQTYFSMLTGQETNDNVASLMAVNLFLLPLSIINL